MAIDNLYEVVGVTELLLVAVGGGIGSITRYSASNWAAARWGSAFPYGTLLVNAVGCLIIGAFMTMITERFIINPYWRLLVTVGFLGGLTTFSSFSYETLKLISDGNVYYALYNIAANSLIGLLATWLGISLARLV
ncbi:MAG: CrcB-like protein [Firmicutes bacterium]|nr:CrcB-like protein [Bacillota bacterium]